MYQRGSPTWRLHTGLRIFAQNILHEYLKFGSTKRPKTWKSVLFVSYITLQFLDFIHWTVFCICFLLRDSDNDLSLQIKTLESTWLKAIINDQFYSPRYGDRYPKSVPGRLIGIVSILLGTVMDVLFIAVLTSSLTVFVFDLAANPDRGKKVSKMVYFLSRAGTSVWGCKGGCIFRIHKAD